jgi:putative phosphoribosyl transferase
MKTAHQIKIDLPDNLFLEGDLSTPPDATGVVLFAHGSGSSRHSRRNQFVAQAFHKGHLGTLLFDFMTDKEERARSRSGSAKFDINVLAERLIAAAKFLRNAPTTLHLNIGIFGASTGGGAALIAAARKPEWIKAAVSRGGRPDLAMNLLSLVQAPTLLIVGENDPAVLHLNEDAYLKLTCEKRLEVIRGAGHFFKEREELEQVAALAKSWFQRTLKSGF